MKKVLFSFFAAGFIAVSAQACMDPSAKALPIKSVLESYKGNASFSECTAKLKNVGVKLSKSFVYRKDRDLNSSDPVIYQLLIMGYDSNTKMVKIKLNYDLRHKGFTCDEGISYRITRGGCF